MVNPALSPCIRQTHKLIVTRELREALDILQMPIADLQAYLTEQLTDNCMLELVDIKENESDGFSAGEAISDSEFGDDIARVGDTLDNVRFAIPDPGSQSGYCLERMTVESGMMNNLHDYLLFQLHLAVKSPLMERVGRYLIGNLDNSGYLRCTLADAAAVLNITPEQIGEALALIQSFDPCGVGARNLSECLRLQLEADPSLGTDAEIYHTAIDIVTDYLEELAERKLNHIALKLKKATAQIRAAARLICGLEPKPGMNFGSPRFHEYIAPDVFVQKIGVEFLVFVNEPEGTNIKVNPVYREVLMKNWLYAPETIDYLKQKLRLALRLIKNIRQRHLTLYRISEAIVKLQRPFFNTGIVELKPMTLRDVAVETGLHESTVSRCIDGKYMDTPFGVIAMKFFFNSSLAGKDSNAALTIPLETPEAFVPAVTSATAVKNMIKIEIEQESKEMPWSDQQLAERLKDKGIHISRRTVAKYREGMKIPPSNLRRTL